MIPNLLSIAGSDPSGGAGIQADLKTFAALGGYGMAAMTSLTAQNTRAVTAVHELPADFVRAQLEAVFEDVRVDGVKIGMAGSVDVIEVIADVLTRYRPEYVVLDPVMVSTSGARLISDAAAQAMRERLLPLADIVTPNMPEAEILSGLSGGKETMGKAILNMGAKAVVVKGGHEGGEEALDILVTQDGVSVFSSPRIKTKNTHGTGCTLSSAIATLLACGMDLEDALTEAKEYITSALRHADELSVGGEDGHGPVHHFYKAY